MATRPIKWGENQLEYCRCGHILGSHCISSEEAPVIEMWKYAYPDRRVHLYARPISQDAVTNGG